MCRETDTDTLASLGFVNWCGDLNANQQPQLRCDIDDTDKTTHYVEIENNKTYDRIIVMKGILRKSRAMFEPEDAVVNGSHQWEHSFTLYGADREQVKAARICKVKNNYGTELVDVEINYDSQWAPNQMKLADTSNLRLKINVR